MQNERSVDGEDKRECRDYTDISFLIFLFIVMYISWVI